MHTVEYVHVPTCNTHVIMAWQPCLQISNQHTANRLFINLKTILLSREIHISLAGFQRALKTNEMKKKCMYLKAWWATYCLHEAKDDTSSKITSKHDICCAHLWLERNPGLALGLLPFSALSPQQQDPINTTHTSSTLKVTLRHTIRNSVVEVAGNLHCSVYMHWHTYGKLLACSSALAAVCAHKMIFLW